MLIRVCLSFLLLLISATTMSAEQCSIVFNDGVQNNSSSGVITPDSMGWVTYFRYDFSNEPTTGKLFYSLTSIGKCTSSTLTADSKYIVVSSRKIQVEARGL